MKGKIFAICFMSLIIITSLMFSNSLSFALYEPETTVIARADEMDYRFSEAQEEEMKEEEWYVVPEDDGNEVIILPDEDIIKNDPYKWDTEDEGSPEPYKFEEEEPEDEPSTDTESRR
jgi:hypothetical protein